MDYINFTKEAEFEYMPVSLPDRHHDQKWVEKLCAQNYRIGAGRDVHLRRAPAEDL